MDKKDRSKAKKEMVLYHAISAYQLFEVMVHRLKYHKNNYAVLLLPDFIVEKYPHWRQIETSGIFEEVHLFHYMLIPHNKETILKDLEGQYNAVLAYPADEFCEIYVAGAHFYFSVYLIEKGIPFIVFEDAPGMLGQEERLYENLQKNYPVHAQITEEYGMFRYTSALVKYVLCDRKNRNRTQNEKTFPNTKIFRPVFAFRFLPKNQKNKIYAFFKVSDKKINIRNKIVILTQNFAGLGIMPEDRQREIYMRLSGILNSKKVFLKVHPDDGMQYEEIFEGAEFLPRRVPVEVLLPLLKGKPGRIITFSSSAGNCMENKYPIINFSQKFREEYDFHDEYNSVMNIIGKLEDGTWKL